MTGDPRSVISDLKLHAMTCGLDESETAMGFLESGVTALAFHLAVRPPEEFVAWTAGFGNPPVESFLTANGREGSVVGRASESEEKDDYFGSFFTCQAKQPDEDLEDDTIFFDDPPTDFYEVLEQHYLESYERRARFFARGDERAFLVSLPGADGAWIDDFGDEAAFLLPDRDDVEFVEDRVVVFHCGCDREKIIQHLVANYGDNPDAFFGSQKAAAVQCPRCGVLYEVAPEDYERWRTPNSGRG